MHELEGIARTIECSKTDIVRKAIESYHQDYADYLFAIERLSDKNDEIISSDEMRSRLALYGNMCGHTDQDPNEKKIQLL